MRYLSMIKSSENYGPPPKALMDAMGPLMAETLGNGSLIQTGGLASSTKMVRVRSSGGKITVTDGPFTESKELVGGYAVLEHATLEEAIEATRRFMDIHAKFWPEWTGECELREITFIAP